MPQNIFKIFIFLSKSMPRRFLNKCQKRWQNSTIQVYKILYCTDITIPLAMTTGEKTNKELFYKEYSILAPTITSQKLSRYNDHPHKWFKRAQNCRELCDIIRPLADTCPFFASPSSPSPEQRTFWHAKLTEGKESKKRDGKGINVCGWRVALRNERPRRE